MNRRHILPVLLFCAFQAAAVDQIANSYPPVIQGNARAVAVDSNGNRYVAGSFQGAVDFNPAVGEDSKTSSGNDDVFVTRFNADGSYAWTQTFGGTGADAAYGLVCSAAAVYVTGTFASTNAGIGGPGTFSRTGGNDVLVMALNLSDGTPLAGFGNGGLQKFGGSTISGGATIEEGSRLAISNGTLYVAGTFCTTNAGVGGTSSISTVGGSDGFVLALHETTGVAVTGFGNLGVQRFGSSGNDTGRGIAVGGSRVYLAGSFVTTAGIGSAANGVTSAGLSDAFVCALNVSNGSAASGFGTNGVRPFGGASSDFGRDLVLLGTALYVSGDYSSTAPRLGGLVTPGTTGATDGFVFAVNATSGAPVASFGFNGMQKFGGTGDDFGSSIAASGSSLYVAGYFSSVNFGFGGPGVFASRGFEDAYCAGLSAVTGTPLGAFGSSGFHQFGGGARDVGAAAAAAGSSVFFAGNFQSVDAALNGAGSFDSTGFGGFLETVSAVAAPAEIPKINWPKPADIAFGTPLGPIQQNATASVPGTFAYFPPPGTQLNIGFSQTLWVMFTPADFAAYESVVASVQIDVLPPDQIAATYPPLIRGDSFALAADARGYRYVTGAFSGFVDLNPGPGSDPKLSAGQDDVFVTCFDDSGAYLWTQTFGGSGDDSGTAIAVSGGVVYAAGVFTSSNAGFGSAGAYSTTGVDDAFVLALNADTGIPVAAFGNNGFQKFGGTSDDAAVAIAVAGGTVYVSGEFISTNAGVGGIGTLATTGAADGFLLALNTADGLPKSGFGTGGVQRFCGTAVQSGAGVTEYGGVLYWVGRSTGSGGGLGGLGTFSAVGGDAIIVALNADSGAPVAGFGNGGLQWFGGSSSDQATSVMVAGSTLFVAGYFNSSNATIGGAGSAVTAGNDDAFLLKLDLNTGAPIANFGNSGAVVFGGSSADRAQCMCASNTTLFLAGRFSSASARLLGNGSFSTTGGIDAFVLALDLAAGGLVTTFGTGGLQKFGGSGADYATGVAVVNSTLLLNGYFTSNTAGIGGFGSYNYAAGFAGYLLPLNSADGTFTPPSHETRTTAADIAAAFSVADQAVVISAKVTAAATHIMDGTVTIQVKDGANDLGSPAAGVVFNDQASITYIIPGGTPLGSYTIEARYEGTIYFPSSDNQHVLRVVEPGVMTAQNAADTYHSQNFSVALQASITDPAGTVNEGTAIFQIKNGNKVISTSPPAPVVNGEVSAACGLPGGTAVGEYSIIATYSGGANFAPNSDATKKLTIARAPATVTANNAASTVSPQSTFVTLSARVDSPAGTVAEGTVVFQIKSGAQNVGAAVSAPLVNQIASVSYSIPGGTPAGVYTIDAAYSAPDNFLNAADSAHSLTIAKGIPKLDWSHPAPISYGTPLDGSQLNAAAGIDGTFVYDPLAGTVLQGGGAQILSATFFPADSTQYESAQATVKIDVLKALLTIVADNKSKAVGSVNPPLTATFSGFVNNDSRADVAGQPDLQTPVTAATPAGVYPITVNAGSLSSPDYDFEFINGTLNVVSVPDFSNLSAPVIGYGTTPTRISGSITFGTTGAVSISIGSISASAAIDGSSNFAANLPTGTLELGTHTIQYFYPGGAGLLPRTEFRNLTVVKRAAIITWANPAEIEFGTPLSSTQLNATADAAGTFAYTPAAGAILAAGAQQLSTQFTPNDGVHFSSVSASVTLAVRKAAPQIVWAAPAGVVYGAALSDEQLNASCAVAGMLTYDPPAGTILRAGLAQTLAVQFMPDNPANFESASAVVHIDVFKAPQTISLDPVADQELGTAPLTLSASASSNLPVTLTCISSVAELAGNVLTLNAAGSVVIRAEQPGDDDYEAASPVESNFNIVIIPPQITTALVVSGTQNQPFQLALTAKGTGPLTWTARRLAPGLVFNPSGPDLSGTPNVSGAFQTEVSVSNSVGSDTKIITLVFASAAGGENQRPRFTSQAAAAPNPAAVNQTIVFSVSATDFDNDAVVFVWDFGDGAAGAGAGVEHKYAAAGIYNARVTVSDGVLSDYFNLAVVINESNIPPEIYAQFTVAKLGLKFNFAKPSADSLSISGTLPIPAAFAPAGAAVVFQSGSLPREFTLDKKGASAGFKLSGKLAKDGTFTASPAKFALALKNQDLFSGLQELGYRNANVAKGTIILTPIVITLGSTRYLATVAAAYTAKLGKSGAGKK